MFDSEELGREITELFSQAECSENHAFTHGLSIRRPGDDSVFQALNKGKDKSAEDRRYRAKLKADPVRKAIRLSNRRAYAKASRVLLRCTAPGGLS